MKTRTTTSIKKNIFGEREKRERDRGERERNREREIARERDGREREREREREVLHENGYTKLNTRNLKRFANAY